MTTSTTQTDPIAALAAALPQCRAPRAVTLDLTRTFPGRYRSGAPFTSPFSCGAVAVAYEVRQMIAVLAESEGQAIAAEARGHLMRGSLVRQNVEATRDRYLAVLARMYADPVECTCPAPETTAR
jgi:hypothetical protein